jgi:hypothetical protein
MPGGDNEKSESQLGKHRLQSLQGGLRPAAPVLAQRLNPVILGKQRARFSLIVKAIGCAVGFGQIPLPERGLGQDRQRQRVAFGEAEVTSHEGGAACLGPGVVELAHVKQQSGPQVVTPIGHDGHARAICGLHGRCQRG